MLVTPKIFLVFAFSLSLFLFEWSYAAGTETIYISKSETSLTTSKNKNITIIKTGIFANKKPRVIIPDNKRWTQLKADDCLCVDGKPREIQSINYDQHHKRYIIKLFIFEADRTLAACKDIECKQ